VNGQSLSGSLTTVWLLLVFSLMSVAQGGEYMTVSRSSAIVNITYHSYLTDSLHSEVSCSMVLSFIDRICYTIFTLLFFYSL